VKQQTGRGKGKGNSQNFLLQGRVRISKWWERYNMWKSKRGPKKKGVEEKKRKGEIERKCPSKIT